MFRSTRVRILLSLVLTVAAIAGSFLLAPGIRHRHDGGAAAHTHSGHVHSHGHSHLHSHRHSHSQSTHSPQGDHDSHKIDTPVEEEPLSHIHFSLFGFQLTLPDFLGGEPAPLVDSNSDSRNENAAKGDMIRLPSPFSLAQLIDVTLRWTAIGCSRVQLDGTAHPFTRTVVASEINRGLDPSAPPVPPPQGL